MQNPLTQTILARIATTYLSKKLNTEVKIEKLNITGFRSISLTNLLLKDIRHDTLIYSKQISATMAGKPLKLDFTKLKSVSLENAIFRLNKPIGRDQSNLGHILDFFSSGDSTKKEKSEKISIAQDGLIKNRKKLHISKLLIVNSSFSYIDENIQRDKEGIDFKDTKLEWLNLDAEDLIMLDDTFMVRVKHISVFEKSGFRVDSLACDFKISPVLLQAMNLKITTPLNKIDLDFSFNFESFQDFKDFINKVNIKTTIRPSLLNLTEVGFFAPVMFNMYDRLRVSANIRGTVSNFKAKDLKVGIGRTTQFRGNVQMNGLPDIRETYSHLTIHNFITTIEDVRKFRLPTDDIFIDLPEMLQKFGLVKIKGKFTGFYNDFVSYGSFKTGIGDFNTDILLRVNEDNTIAYDGNLSANDFNAGRFFNLEKNIGKLDLTANLKGYGVSFENMSVSMEGVIDSLDFFQNQYNEIAISGNLQDQKFNGQFNVRDENVFLDFIGSIDYGKNIPEYNFSAQVKDAYLNKINLVNRDESSQLSTNLQINFMGDKIDNTQGIIIIDSTNYRELEEDYFMEALTLSITRDSSEYAFIRLFSDIVDATAEGKFALQLLPQNIKELLNTYLDTLFTDPQPVNTELSNQDFIFSVKLKNTQAITDLFVPDLQVKPGTKFSGGYNSRISNLFIDGESPEILYKGTEINNWYLEYFIQDKSMQLVTGAKNIFYSDTLRSDSVKVHLTAMQDSIGFNLNWEDFSDFPFFAGSVTGNMKFSGYNKFLMHFHSSKINFSNTLWNISDNNKISFDSSFLQLDNVILNSLDQEINLDGTVSYNPHDTLSLFFKNFNLSNFDRLLQTLDIDLDGFIDGNIRLIDLYNSPFYLSDLHVSDLYFNEEKLGQANIKSIWDSRQKAFDIESNLVYTGNSGQDTTLSIAGKYYPDDSKRNFDINLNLNKYKVTTLEPFTKSFSSDIGGMASGNLFLKGTKSAPELTGEINLMRIAMLIDYINVKYYFADKIYFDKNKIYFDNILVSDSLSNQALATGRIYHNHLSDFDLDLNFSTSNLLGLSTNRSQNNVFYGVAMASGGVSIKGPVSNLVLDINVRSEKGTNIKIPVSYDTDIGSNDYIVFVSEEKIEESTFEEKTKTVDIGGLTLNVDLDVTNDADIQLFMPYNMGNIRGKGKGDLKMHVNPEGQFTMEGDYKIDRGSFFFTLRNIINRSFDIRRGSRIVWTGDPYDARINMKAVYKVKTYLGDYGPPSEDSTRVPVDCIISLRNSLLNPDIHFMVDFPDLKDDTKQFVYSRLDTSDQAEMSRQMISLLVLNNFYRSEGFSGSVGFNTFDLVTNQLNNWLSQISNDFDIGVNYRPGDEISAQEVEVALSTQLFDDRVLIDGNVGMKGEESTTTTKTNTIVGEVNVEVKITQDGRFRAKAFNRSNNNYLYRSAAPYTQGVGVFYTQEFDRLNEIFSGKKRKQKKEQKKQEIDAGKDTVKK